MFKSLPPDQSDAGVRFQVDDDSSPGCLLFAKDSWPDSDSPYRLREIVVCRFESSRCSTDENEGGVTINIVSIVIQTRIVSRSQRGKIKIEIKGIDAENLARSARKSFEDREKKGEKKGDRVIPSIEWKNAGEKGLFLSLSIPHLCIAMA